MKRKTLLTTGAVAAVVLTGAVVLPAIAGGPNGGWGPCQGGPAVSDPGGPGMMMRHGMRGPWGWQGGSAGSMGPAFFQTFDANGDGAVSANEAEAGIEALRSRHDTDGDGALSREEFGALFAQATGSFADRPFAMLDADENGTLSAEEMRFPAQMMARMNAWHGTTSTK
jgi:Ca2+-binding EF-hand superfamily protein